MSIAVIERKFIPRQDGLILTDPDSQALRIIDMVDCMRLIEILCDDNLVCQ